MRRGKKYAQKLENKNTPMHQCFFFPGSFGVSNLKMGLIDNMKTDKIQEE